MYKTVQNCTSTFYTKKQNYTIKIIKESLSFIEYLYTSLSVVAKGQKWASGRNEVYQKFFFADYCCFLIKIIAHWIPTYFIGGTHD